MSEIKLKELLSLGGVFQNYESANTDFFPVGYYNGQKQMKERNTDYY